MRAGGEQVARQAAGLLLLALVGLRLLEESPLGDGSSPIPLPLLLLVIAFMRKAAVWTVCLPQPLPLPPLVSTLLLLLQGRRTPDILASHHIGGRPPVPVPVPLTERTRDVEARGGGGGEGLRVHLGHVYGRGGGGGGGDGGGGKAASRTTLGGLLVLLLFANIDEGTWIAKMHIRS